MKERAGASRVQWFMLCAVAVVGLGAGSAQAVQGQTNAVYLNANIGTTPSANVILGYNNDGHGNLTPLPGSPYSTGGTGSAPATGMSLGLQTDDDQQVIINKAGKLLFTVNGFSNTIAVFNINSDASLTPVAGSPSTSGGPQPASLGLFDGVLPNGNSVLVAVNKESDPNQVNPKQPNFQTFTLGTDGVLVHNVGSQITLPYGASPSQAAIGKQRLVFGMQFAGGGVVGVPSQIYSYRVMSNGLLKLNGTTTSPTGNIFLGEVVHPTQTILYAALPADSQIAVYQYSTSTGLLTYQTSVANQGGLPCWLTINASGTKLYSGESATNSITVYDLSNPLLPVQVQHLTLAPTSAGSSVTNMRFDPTGTFLYAISNSPTSSSLHVMNVSADGIMTETVSPLTLPVPSGNFPIGLATLMK